MADDTGQYSPENLGNYSYRYLQKLAKSMGLPSNVKKVYIVELIIAYKFKTQKELNEIVHRVKLERRQQSSKKRSKVKKLRVQGAEITSTSNSSPPISVTPKRRSIVMTHSPDRKTIAKPSSEHRLYNNSLKAYQSSNLTRSDRVLRSFRDRPNYRMMSMNNSMIGVIKAPSPKTRINIVSQRGTGSKLNVTAFVKKPSSELERQLVSYPGSLVTPSERLRQRRISGISPLATPEEPRKFTPTIQFTRRDGRMSTLNAFVQKQLPPICYNRERNVIVQDSYQVNEQNTQNVITEQDTNNIPTLSLTEMIQDKYRNGKNDTYYDIVSSQDVRPDIDDRMEYYHKKIRAEHVRNVKVTQICNVEERLPCINEVFSKFNDLNLRNLMEPIHVEVSEESERAVNMSSYMPRISTHGGLLECVYNFRTQFLTNQPLLQIAPRAKTKSVYSTPTISTAMQQPTTSMVVDQYNASYMRDNSYVEMSGAPAQCAHNDTHASYERDFTCSEVLSPSSSSSEDSQDLGANVTIPEMVEDALELISQDGDYMERIGMDTRMQCVLCDWAGPKFILEHHVRKEHSTSLQEAEAGSWCVRIPLSALRLRHCMRHILARGTDLLLLTAEQQDALHFSAILHTLSSDGEPPRYGKITIYNKVTGEPYIWRGEVQEFNETSEDIEYFRIELAKINLLPNSANLMLINRELVLKSPTNVVVGSHAVDDINIVMFVEYE